MGTMRATFTVGQGLAQDMPVNARVKKAQEA